MPADILALIERRRRQLLVHSFIYYHLDGSAVDDHTWQRWADELVDLQFWHGREIGPYDAAFRDWDASTGFHLPRDFDIERVARRTLEQANLIALTA
jgi:hypothetical protein